MELHEEHSTHTSVSLHRRVCSFPRSSDFRDGQRRRHAEPDNNNCGVLRRRHVHHLGGHHLPDETAAQLDAEHRGAADHHHHRHPDRAGRADAAVPGHELAAQQRQRHRG